MPSGFSTATAGAELTQEEVQQLLLEPLLAQSVVLTAGPTVIRSDGGTPVRLPKINAWNPSDYWRAENTQIAETDPTYEEIVLLASTLKSIKVLHRVSNELVRHGVVEVSQALSDALVRRVALALDLAFLRGDGGSPSGTQPVGIFLTTGRQTIASVGSPVVDDLFDAERIALTANANAETLAWFMAPRDFATLRKQREGAGTGQYLLQPNPTEAGRYQLLGHPVYTSTQLPTNLGAGTNESQIALVPMDQIVVAIDQEPTITVLTERYGDYDQIAIRITARADIGVVNPEAVIILDNVTA